jgi:polyisoprenoid-binding protein YceI
MTTSRNWPSILCLMAILNTSCISAAPAAEVVGWQLDPAKSRLGFSVVQTGTKFEGMFTRYDTNIVFDPDHLDASHIAVTIDLASVVTGDTQRDAALPGADWFAVAQFPQARFETTAIRKQRANAYQAVGNLTLRGVTKPLTVLFTLQITGTSAHAVGHAEVVRTSFGVGQGPWATGQWVALEVEIDLDIVATRRD